MKAAILTFACALFLTPFLHAQIASTSLDGKKFSITLMKDGKVDAQETLVFDNGTFDPVQCHQYGFTATTYQAKWGQEMSSFRADCKSDKEGTMTWDGRITGDKIEGSLVWRKEGQPAIHYTYKGTAVAIAGK